MALSRRPLIENRYRKAAAHATQNAKLMDVLSGSLRKPITALGEWAFANRSEIEAARAIFDAKASP